ncbi:GPN-loop GTPase 3 [Gryllus bimaculatus]|nr:GPN-loop GTPase 3 [Gryllus bimaculatus]
MRYGQLVIGPAGSGKSTYCSMLSKHGADMKRTIDVVNLDPAAEYFDYEPLADIRSLIEVSDAMEDSDLQFGPNGGLIFCMEYLLENNSWFEEALGDVEDDYIIFDCPGQIELYTHMNTMRDLVEILQNRLNFRLCAVFILDSQFMVDVPKFLSVRPPPVNQLRQMEIFIEPQPDLLLEEVENSPASRWGEKYRNLTSAISQLIEDYSLVRFVPLDRRSDDSLPDLLLTIDNILQYGEDADVKTHDFEYPDDEDKS